jgi:hypothetical protein
VHRWSISTRLMTGHPQYGESQPIVKREWHRLQGSLQPSESDGGCLGNVAVCGTNALFSAAAVPHVVSALFLATQM